MRSAATASGGTVAPGSTRGGSSIWNTRAPGAFRAHALGEARADRDHGGRVGERECLEACGQAGQRPPAGEARVAELVGDRRVHVHHQGQAEQAGEGGREVGSLFHRVDHVVSAQGHARPGLEHEGYVEHELGQGGPRPDPTHEGHRE